MKIAIVGGSPSTQMMAPFDDTEYDIWVLGNQMQQYEGKRVSRIFEIHDDLSEHDARYAQWLVDFGIPMIVGDKFPITAKHISVFDKKMARDILPFFSSSPAYMMAQAIIEGVDEIQIYGVDMAVDDHEYFKQRPDMYAWITCAKERGIKVFIPEQSSLYRSNYDEGTDYNVNTPFSETQLLSLARMHEQKAEEAKAQFTSHDSARQVYERLAKVARGINSGVNIKTLSETVKI
jgi:hypothetical protein